MIDNWHLFSFEEVASRLGVDIDKGLSEAEVIVRQKQFGQNVLPKEKTLSKLRTFFNQFRSPLIYILIIASLITLFLREWADSIVILGAVVLNTIVGFFQENKASQSLKALKKIVTIQARVIRGGNEVNVDSADLVPGDIITLTAGSKISADARVISANNLKVNEAPLTGEWLSSSKTPETLSADVSIADRDNMVYMGCIVEEGKGQAVVVSTGQNTEIGRIASLVKETPEEKTPLQKKLAKFSKIVGLFVGLMAFLIFIGGVLNQKEVLEMFMISVAVAVAAVPEGLPVAMTVILALGMQRILKRKGLVRQLVAAETLGSTSIIATDKTLTLTEGNMEAVETITLSCDIIGEREVDWRDFFRQNFDEDQILLMKILALSNEAFVENPQDIYPLWSIKGRATDKALLTAGAEVGLKKYDLERAYSKVEEIPFNSQNKFIATLFQADPLFYKESLIEKSILSLIRGPMIHGAEQVLFVSGAPEKLLSISSNVQKNGQEQKITDDMVVELNNQLEALAKKGLRVVGAAYKKINNPEQREKKLEKEVKELTFVGFIGLKDPLREEAKTAINICQKAGMRPIIVTGDHLLTAKAVGKELGLKIGKENVLEGQDLDKMSEKEFQEKVKDIEIYARVEPRHKLRIISAWQERGKVVAMTGDGVNDAPALKKADIGVALGSGTDVAKEVSDLVLLTDNFNIIVSAVEEGRAIIDNIRKVITYLLSSSFTETILIGASIILGWPLPVIVVQILWINLITDGLPGLALAFEQKEKDILQRKPEDKEARLFTGEMKVIIFIIGILTDFLLLGLFWWLFKSGYDIQYVRTMIFAGLGINSLFYIFSCKSLRKNIWRINPFSNKFLIVSVLFGFFMLVSGVYLPAFQTLLRTVPLAFNDWLILGVLGFANIIFIEIAKYYFIARHKI
ncbi:MAG: HAD-IC family P-type ATPase [Candidatus Nealsonbacteria bacterium]|nr:HAD-IC family P-type ATPase [Candidatus Nealsonbacteria bacterium]